MAIVKLQWLEHLQTVESVLEMGGASHWELIIAPVQEANKDKLGMAFRSSIK